MIKVHYVKQANVDNSAVTAGNPYYWWKVDGVKYYSATEPTSDQLASDSFVTAIIGWLVGVEDVVFESYADADTFITQKIAELTVIRDDLQLQIDDIKQWEDFALGVELVQKMSTLESMFTLLENDIDLTELQAAEDNYNTDSENPSLVGLYTTELQKTTAEVREIARFYMFPVLPAPLLT